TATISARWPRPATRSSPARSTSWRERSSLAGAAAAAARTRARRPPRSGGRAGRDAVGVEHRLDVAQARDRPAQPVRVGDLDHEAILDHRRGRQAARLDDVGAGLRERARDVLEQPVAVPRVDLYFDDERGRLVAFPGDRREALGIPAQQDDVGTVLAMDRDAAPERDVAHDVIAGHGPAALGQALPAQVLLQHLAPRVLGVLTRLSLEPLLDLVSRARGLDGRQPVARRATLALGGEDLDPVTGLQLVVQRDDLAVHASAHAAVA